MAYRVTIKNESGQAIPSTAYFYDAEGALINSFPIPAAGADLPEDLVLQSTTIHIDAPGYVGYSTLSLGETQNIVLVKETKPGALPILLIIAIATKVLKLW